jgi:hypothetical protein
MTHCTSRRGTEIDHPTVHEWSAIVDAHRHGPAVAAIDDGHLRAEWQRAVRGCHLAGIHNLAGRGLAVAVLVRTAASQTRRDRLLTFEI